jgi:DNA-binding HxlR family transcriptional regulator
LGKSNFGVEFGLNSPGWEGRPSQPEIFLPGINFARCPIGASLGTLGKKWTLLILRDIGFRKIDRFNRLLESVQGIGPRILSRRLSELEADGYIECVENRDSPIMVRWALTDKGRDALAILLQFIAFGSKWYSDEVFSDGKPRKIKELFRPEVSELIQLG